jgi:hypothetical protein
MNTYTKEVIYSGGFVDATLYRNGVSVAFNFFNTGSLGPFFRTPASVEKAFIRAHKWADQSIEVLKRNETTTATE